MKTTGIIFLVIGALSTLGGVLNGIAGREPHLGGLTFAVLGLFLISRANKKKKAEEEKKQWEEGDSDND